MNTKTQFSARQNQFLQRASVLSFAALLLGAGAASAQNNHFKHAVADPTWIDSSTMSKHFCIQSVDIDGDMDIDLFLTNGGYGGTGQALFLKNEGTPTDPNLSIQQTYYGLENYPIHSLVFGDLDSDGDLDVVYRKYMPVGQDSVFYLANSGSASAPVFSVPAVHLFNVRAAAQLYSMSLVDLDNNGDLELLTHDLYGNIAYYANNGSTTPSFTAATLPSGLIAHSAGAQFAFVDMDNDGDQDVWKTYEYPAPGGIAYSQNTGTATSPTFGNFSTFPMGMDSIYVGTTDRVGGQISATLDVDDDGDVDILTYPNTNNTYYTAFFFENTKCDTNNTAPIISQSLDPNIISTAAGAATYQWFSVNAQGARTPVQGATRATFMPTTSGNYTVRAKKANGCVAYAADFAFTMIGVETVADARLWNIMPNPATSEIFVQSDLTWLRWEIIDAQGRVIRTIAKPTTSSINISELPQGMYTLRGQSIDGKSAISRFVKK